jgi:hypothetical protein
MRQIVEVTVWLHSAAKSAIADIKEGGYVDLYSTCSCGWGLL